MYLLKIRQDGFAKSRHCLEEGDDDFFFLEEEQERWVVGAVRGPGSPWP
jgi:hypothetical protein